MKTSKKSTHITWVLTSGATYHITDNKSLLSSLSTKSNLPSITMTTQSRVSSHGVGTINIFPSLSIDNVIYVPRSPFNYYPLIISLVPLIVLFLSQKILFIYMTKVWDG